MRLRKGLALFALLAAVGGGVLFYCLPTDEPSYQGKPLSLWIRGLEIPKNYPTDELRAALRAMGEPAVTRLIELLQRHDSAMKREFLVYAGHHMFYYRYLQPRDIIPDYEYHSRAARALGEIGPSAGAAIPALMSTSISSNAFDRLFASVALIKVRQEPITPLLATLEDNHSTNWRPEFFTFMLLGTNAAAAVPLLVSHLQSTNVGIRGVAVHLLGGIASRPDISVPALIGCLQDQSAAIRRDALVGLSRFKDAKPQIVPILMTNMESPDFYLWLSAAQGLQAMLTKEENRIIYVPALIKSLSSADKDIRDTAREFLKDNDPAAASKVGIK
ncbi:MAG: HEAT repeat domain-containing protein [Limisphaerales bacterium]